MNQPAQSIGGLIRLRLDFAYDGTDFSGWAKQPGLRTVQGEILDALAAIFNRAPESFALVVAGRTDKGVHAANQVAHLDLTAEQVDRHLQKLRLRMNSLLPEDIRIYNVAVAPKGFDARFAAIYRRYRYQIADGAAIQSPIAARTTLFVRRTLDLNLMQAAALGLYGLHDFASFCRPRPGSTTIRELREVKITRRPIDPSGLGSAGADGVIEIELLADAFCHNMVRSIVGALIAVGEGRANSLDIAELLARADRTTSYKVVDPRGLTLLEIGYPAPELMATQVANAQALRTQDDIDAYFEEDE